MRFLLLLIIAIGATLTWQSAVSADPLAGPTKVYAKDAGKKGTKSGAGDEEPECE